MSQASRRLHEADIPETLTQVCPQLAADVAAAALSGFVVAPPVTIIDRSVVEKIARGEPMSRGIRIACIDALHHPLRFCLSRPFGASWILYAATYALSNTSQTLTRNLEKTLSSSITFAATMLVNVPLGVWKDISFARTYGASKAATTTMQSVTLFPSKVSKAATLTFLARDGLTIFGSFVMAPAMASSIPDSVANDAHTKALITQLSVPIISQWFATPLHLLGLDFHNRQQRVNFSGRIHRIKGDLLSSTLMRCVRIIPAFGVGCIANAEARLAFQNIATEIIQ